MRAIARSLRVSPFSPLQKDHVILRLETVFSHRVSQRSVGMTASYQAHWYLIDLRIAFWSHPRIAAGGSQMQRHQANCMMVPSSINDGYTHAKDIIVTQNSCPFDIETFTMSWIISVYRCYIEHAELSLH